MQGSRCLKKGMQVSYMDEYGQQHTLTSSIGCTRTRCCFNLYQALDYKESGCNALAVDSGFVANDLCKSGYCDSTSHGGSAGTCLCDIATSWDPYQGACIVRSPVVHYQSDGQGCPPNHTAIGGGCRGGKSALGALGTLPSTSQVWTCDSPSATAVTICSPNIKMLSFGETGRKKQTDDGTYYYARTSCVSGQEASVSVRLLNAENDANFHLHRTPDYEEVRSPNHDILANGFQSLCFQNVKAVSQYVKASGVLNSTSTKVSIGCQDQAERLVGGYCFFAGWYSTSVKIALYTKESYPKKTSDGTWHWVCVGGADLLEMSAHQSNPKNWPRFYALASCMRGSTS